MKTVRIAWNATLGSFGAAVRPAFTKRGASGDGTSHMHRVHIFAGVFANEADMSAYCFTPVVPHGPAQLNRDLPGASLNTRLIDAAFGHQIPPRLTAYFRARQQRRIQARMKPGEVLVLIPMRAFDGMGFRLHDTQRLRYLGYEDSLAMTAAMMAS